MVLRRAVTHLRKVLDERKVAVLQLTALQFRQPVGVLQLVAVVLGQQVGVETNHMGRVWHDTQGKHTCEYQKAR